MIRNPYINPFSTTFLKINTLIFNENTSLFLDPLDRLLDIGEGTNDLSEGNIKSLFIEKFFYVSTNFRYPLR